MKTGIRRATEKQLALDMIEMCSKEKRLDFEYMGNGGWYTAQQKEYAFDLIGEYGIRATSRILQMPRRTLQRWCNKGHIFVKRCPDWVYDWAKRRRKRREFWIKNEYFQ